MEAHRRVPRTDQGLEVRVTKVLSTEEGTRRLSVSFSAPSGTWTGVIGPSGSGKTTLLRMIAGLETPDNGVVRLDNRLLFSSENVVCVTPHQRGCALVFQQPLLFPHLTVGRNVAYGCGDPDLAHHLLTIAGLTELAQRKVQGLSGGQKQRISLLRAVASQPSLLLLDEPFSALDKDKRQFFIEVVIRLYEELKFQVLLVSHDQEEIQGLCDGVVDVEWGVRYDVCSHGAGNTCSCPGPEDSTGIFLPTFPLARISHHVA